MDFFGWLFAKEEYLQTRNLQKFQFHKIEFTNFFKNTAMPRYEQKMSAHLKNSLITLISIMDKIPFVIRAH